MKRILAVLVLAAVAAIPVAAPSSAQSDKTIVGVAASDPQFSTLVGLVQKAGLAETLSKGSFTVFAPTNAAFAALPEGTVPALLKPENKEQLTKVLTYHVVPGRLDAAALMKAIKRGDGKATLTTASGESLWIMMNGDRNVVVRDAKGGVAAISTYDVVQSNGVIHVVDKVLLPS
jgi:uncharacterized surface protein with fasciclin (FAS1) repeats